VNLNATLFAQLVVFLILAWFTMKFVWPPIMKALDERASKIADGLAAADKAVESKMGGCCQKAADKNETCKHPCCVEAAKAGNNCTKCGGSGPLAKKAEAKK